MTTALTPPEVRSAHRAQRERGLLARAFLGRAGDPGWARPALWAILLLSAVLYTWNLSANGDANGYYAAAISSGTQSWKAFFFGAIDAGSFITVDKPPFALWVMGISTRIFGYGTWQMLLPQALAGVAAVGVLYTAVRRSFGPAAATIAALVMALTPITVAINRDNNPDTVLVLLLVLSAWAALTAIRTGGLLPLAGAAVATGCAFNTKMLQGFLVLPALALVYLVCADTGLGRRVRNLLVAGVALVVSSGWWMGVVALVPAANRPYIGGSTDNTVWDLVIGYNGLGRIFGNGGGGGGGGGQGGSFGGVSGIGRMFNSIMGGQISWLIPAAALGLLAGLAIVGRGRGRTDDRRAQLLVWGGWLVITYLVFSLAEGTFHPYYSTALAPAIAALTGIGATLVWTGSRATAWVLPLGAAVTGGWAFALLRRTPDWQPWLAWTIAAATVVAVAALLVRAYAGGGRAVAVTAVVTALVAGLAGPAAFAVSAANSVVQGTNPTAGPSSGGGMGGPGGGMGGRPGMTGQRPAGMTGQPPAGTGEAPTGQPPGGQAPGGTGGGGGRTGGGGPGGSVDSAMISYLEKNQGSAQWLVAVSSAQSASSIILRTGKPVIAMGGFTGSDPAMTVAKLKRYAAEGRLKYVLVGGGDRGGGGTSEVTAWVKANGTAVSATEYGGTDSGTSDSTLYELG